MEPNYFNFFKIFIKVNQSKQAITKNAPNGIFSTVKTSKYFHSNINTNQVKTASSKPLPPIHPTSLAKTKPAAPQAITASTRKLRNSTLIHEEIEAPTAASTHLIMNSTKIDESHFQQPQGINLTIVQAPTTNKDHEEKDAAIEEITAKIRDATIIVSNLVSNETKIVTPGIEEVCLNVECQQSIDMPELEEVYEEHQKVILKEIDDKKAEVQTLETVKDIKYYRNLVDINTDLLNNLSNTWTKTNEISINIIPDDMQGDIRSACGLAKLLIDERFAQFNDLIHLSEV